MTRSNGFCAANAGSASAVTCCTGKLASPSGLRMTRPSRSSCAARAGARGRSRPRRSGPGDHRSNRRYRRRRGSGCALHVHRFLENQICDCAGDCGQRRSPSWWFAQLVSLAESCAMGSRGRREPRSAVRPSRWRLCVRALAKQCFASKAPSPLGLSRAIHGADTPRAHRTRPLTVSGCGHHGKQIRSGSGSLAALARVERCSGQLFAEVFGVAQQQCGAGGQGCSQF